MSARSLDLGTDELLCSIDDHVATITLNRPEKRNALSDTLTPALREGLLRIEADPDVRVLVITGAGTAFCAGGDVSRASADPSPGVRRKRRVPARTTPSAASSTSRTP